ncbi:39S ribosomal protein L35, mitochondrial [Belonocnema kinseyi]|uniref:39S ribosomal protein L35, mitochondrial n=1 Tax=Belonocnema kinseyi TaxID=2817044 RepID=UPI00143E05D8|nr:39S ribosomal protein L35, mitochondrial [Belonocnema kinseyi]
MLRIVSAAIRAGVERVVTPNVTNLTFFKSSSLASSICIRALSFHSAQFYGPADLDVCKNRTILSTPLTQNVLSANPSPTTISTRSLIKFSLKKGKRKTVKCVLDRFYRLHWGIWIRTKCGRNSNLWRKSLNRRKRLGRHVFCNATQSWLLDKMVTKFWRRPKYYVDDPYEPYHYRENFNLTRRKPLP